MAARNAWGVGIATIARNNTVLDTWFPRPRLGDADVDNNIERLLTKAVRRDEKRRVQTRVMRIQIHLDVPPADTADAYLRLHLLSWRIVKPGSINLEGIFDVLPLVVFTDRGPCQVEDFEELRLTTRGDSGDQLRVRGVDKFPRMTDYVVPEGVRIADANRVRLGAHLARGTTVLHEGFVNYNAGTSGGAMIRGRVTQGVVVGEGTEIGLGSSLMGSRTAGGREQITVGRHCILGDNVHLEMSLGDNCAVESGLFLTGGATVNVLGVNPHTTRARNLAGENNWLFRRNADSGVIEAIKHRQHGLELNPSRLA